MRGGAARCWCARFVGVVLVSALTAVVLAFWLRTLSHECLSRCVKADLWGWVGGEPMKTAGPTLHTPGGTKCGLWVSR